MFVPLSNYRLLKVKALLVLSQAIWFAVTGEKEKLPKMLIGQKQQLHI